MLQEKIIEIAKRAGQHILKYHRQSDLGLQNKADDSPVTKADLEAHEIIFSAISRISNDVIISEESELNKELDLTNKSFWLVDPLDGTRDFVAGRDTFCVSIALIEAQKPVLGVLYAPATQQLFHAAINEGSFFNGKKICNLSERERLIGVASGAIKASERMLKFLKDAKIDELVRYGSAIKFGRVAQGEADVYPRFGETYEWDTAAGHIICNEAGCEVLDLLSLAPLTYAKANFKNTGFIALRKDLVSQFKTLFEKN